MQHAVLSFVTHMQCFVCDQHVVCASFCCAELLKVASTPSDQTRDRLSCLIAGMELCSQCLLAHPQTKETSSAIIKLYNTVVCYADFVVQDSDTEQIQHCRSDTKCLAVRILHTLSPEACASQVPKNLIMHAMAIPCQCLTFGFTYQTSIGRLFLDVHSISDAMSFILHIFDDGHWVQSDRCGNLIVETLIGGGACIMDMCLCLAIEKQPASIKQLLDESLIQRLLCLVCRQLSILTHKAKTTKTERMLVTCGNILFYCSMMLDVCTADDSLNVCHRLAGPFAIEACRRIWRMCSQNPFAAVSITTPLILLTYAAGFDQKLNYECSNHVTIPLSASLASHFRNLVPIKAAVFLKELAWSCHDSSYIGSIILALQEAHHWDHCRQAGALTEDRVCCLFYLLLIFYYNTRRFLIGLSLSKAGLKEQSPVHEFLETRLQVISDFSNYGSETITLVKLIFEHTDQVIMVGQNNDACIIPVCSAWQRPQVLKLSELVPVAGLEALMRVWFSRLTPISSVLELQPAVSLCLHLLCRPDALIPSRLQTYVSFMCTTLKLYVSDAMSDAPCPFSGLDKQVPYMCADTLQVLFESEASKEILQLMASVVCLATATYAGHNVQEVEWLDSKLNSFGDMQEIKCVIKPLLSGVLFDDDSSVKRVPCMQQQALYWSNFYADLGMCPPVRKCGNFACDNKSGCSESALPSLLCSGCQKVRYCSVKCQKYAWINCGHKEKCVLST